MCCMLLLRSTGPNCREDLFLDPRVCEKFVVIDTYFSLASLAEMTMLSISCSMQHMYAYVPTAAFSIID